MARIKLTITAEHAQAIKAMQQVAQAAKQTGQTLSGVGSGAGSGFSSATKSAGGFLDTLARVNVAAAGIIYVLKKIKETAAAVLGPGFQFNMDTETTELGMTGILQSMTLIDGKAVSFNQAMAISVDTMKKLRIDALRTAANIDELRDAFLAALAPGVRAGMSIDQIRQLTTVSVNAVKSLKIPAQQTIQEIRDLVQGGITASGSTLATALGLTDADIERARNSSEGLFNFLMKRLEGFQETSKRFPDTMRGRLDQLSEYFTMASSKFSEEFEEPIKNGLQTLTDLIGAMNEESGQFEMNPALLGFIDEVKSGLKEVKQLARDLDTLDTDTFEPLSNSVKSVYGAVKDLCSVLMDLARIQATINSPVNNFFIEELEREAKRVQWLTSQVANLVEWLAELAGAKRPTVEPDTKDNDFTTRHREGHDMQPGTEAPGTMTAKFPDAKKAVEQSQTAMKIALAAIAADAKKAAAAIKTEQESIEVLYKQSMLSAEEYARRKTELERRLQQVSVDEAQRKLEAIQSAQYDKNADKEIAVSKANTELDTEIAKLQNLTLSLGDVTKAIGSLDIGQFDETNTFVAQAKAQIGTVLTKSGLEYLNSVLELMGDADEVMKSLAESKGDVSSRQKAALNAKYADLIEKFLVNGMTEAAKAAEDLRKAEFLKLDFAQAQKDLELANGELVTVQEDLLNELASGAKSAAQVSEEYIQRYRDKTQEILDRLKQQLADAGDDRELANKIRDSIRSISEKLQKFFDEVIARIDSALQHELDMINADGSLTRLQREDAIDEAKRRAAAQRAIEYETKAKKIYDTGGNISDALEYEKLAALNRELSKVPTLLDDIRQAGKQGLEDGLLDYLERGVLECRNLGDAFRNLTNSILQSIQRVYAEALTKNIMEALGLSGSGKNSGGSEFKYNSPGVALPGGGTIGLFADGGSLMDSGEVNGPGTSTSDSILAWAQNIKKWIRISDGEWVVRGAAVKKYGTAFLERLNSGKVPVSMIQQYATGGSLSDRKFSGDLPSPQDLTANLSNSTTIPLSIMNVLDPEIMHRYVRTREGKKAIINLIKEDSTLIKKILEHQ